MRREEERSERVWKEVGRRRGGGEEIWEHFLLPCIDVMGR